MNFQYCRIFILSIAFFFCIFSPAKSDTIKEQSEELQLSPETIENSPVLQDWLQEIPDVLENIRNDPSFRTRVRLGYSQFPSNHNVGGLYIGVEDIFVQKTGLTFSAKYYHDLGTGGDRQSIGGNVQYYLLPLGNYVNVAPVIGYHYIETNGYNTDGVNVGIRLVLALSPGGAGDIFITQSFISPGSDNEVGITDISLGYAITENIRLATDFEWQNSIAQKDSRIGISLEWMP